MGLQPSRYLGPYRIVSPLGRGGMGEVYRATDTRLNRDVALKVLPAEFLADADRLDRFTREAQAAAALNHPNILAVFDIGADRGIPFFVCELLEGETLRERLTRGSLPAAEVVDHAAQIARGLAAAHDRGIVHRDLKPENLFITNDGLVKILDFGIARSEHGTTSAQADIPTAAATADGVLLGTAPYMSPEQVRGAPVDHRSDIFSLGAVLYEMLFGYSPFLGASTAETVSAILTKDPLGDVPNAAVPPALMEIMRHCLEKNPRQRFQSAHDMAFDLELVSATSHTKAAPGHGRRTTSARGPIVAVAGVLILAAAAALWTNGALWRPGDRLSNTRATSIAALPFTNFGTPGTEDYFTDGMTDSLITDLSKVQGLVVLARSAVFRYKNQNVDPQAIGRDLGARYVLQGSVQRAGGRVRVNAQLVDATSGYNVWTGRFDEDVKELFALQDKISTEIVSALELTLSPRSSNAGKPKPTDPRAYDAYLQGLYFRHKPDQGALDQAISSFEVAIQDDPGFALAHAALGSAYTQRFFYLDADPQWEQKAFLAIEKALALDPNLAEAYLARGQLAWSLPNGFPHERAVQDLKRAIALNHGLAEGHRELGKVYMHIGLLDKSIESNSLALRLDPGDRTAMMRRAMSYAYMRDCDRALELSDPDDRRGRAQALLCLGRYDEALSILASPENVNDASLLAVILAKTGKGDAARDQIRRLKLEADNVAGLSDLHHAQYNIGATYALFGDVRPAVTWLKKAGREGLPCYPCYEGDPNLAGLRKDPEFREFMQQLRAQWERFKLTL